MKSYTFRCGSRLLLLLELLIFLTFRLHLSVDAAFNAGYVNHGDTKGKYIIINITANKTQSKNEKESTSENLMQLN